MQRRLWQPKHSITFRRQQVNIFLGMNAVHWLSASEGCLVRIEKNTFNQMLQDTEFEKTHVNLIKQWTALHFDGALQHRLDMCAMRVTISVPTKRTNIIHTLLTVQRSNRRQQEKKQSKHVDVETQRKWQDTGRQQEDTRSACRRPLAIVPCPVICAVVQHVSPTQPNFHIAI